MTDEDLRRMVRAAVARHLGRVGAPVPVLPEVAAHSHALIASSTFDAHASSASPWRSHPSHIQYLALVNTSDACVIEPAVACDHCGYCKSHGH